MQAERPGSLLAAAFTALVCCAALWLYTRQNTFPYFYHSDEPGKVEQLVTGQRNFHHPLLMLDAAAIARNAFNIPADRQQLVIMGRWLSALYAAAAVLAFALLGWRVRGPAGSAAGIVLATQHQVFELAHYFKEDTALLLGCGVAFLAIHFYWRRGDALAAAIAGAGCGLCASAKYLGAVMLVPAIFIFVASQRRRGWRLAHWLLLAAGLVAAAVVINWPMLSRPDLFRHSFGRETALVAHPNSGLTGQIPLFEYFGMFAANTNPVIWLLLIAELAAHWRARARRDAFDWLMLVFPFAFALLLSCSTKTNDRYFLPATAGFCYLAAMGALDLPILFQRHGARAAMLSGCALAAASLWNLATTREYLDAFSRDDRAALFAWIRQHVPRDATLAGETHANLPTTLRPERLLVQPLLPQKVIVTRYAADLGDTPGALSAKRIDDLVISESDYGLFFRRGAGRADLVKKRAFYDALFSEAKPLVDLPRGIVIYLHPGLRLYALKSLK
jgi:hypothetical protein